MKHILQLNDISQGAEEEAWESRSQSSDRAGFVMYFEGPQRWPERHRQERIISDHKNVMATHSMSQGSLLIEWEERKEMCGTYDV